VSADAPSTFGSRLRQLRRQAGLTQRDLAQRTGLDFSYLSKLENDRVKPAAADTIVRISRELGVSEEELLALTGKIPSDVRLAVGSTRAAQRFLLAAQQLRLTEAEWDQMVMSLQRLRSD
jgi:HTH-type transcriptional regulator, competence development regulator